MPTTKPTVVITGAFGSLGSAFVRHLLEDGWPVIGLDNNEWALAAFPDSPNLAKRLEDFADLEFAAGGCLLIHCAAYKHVNLGETNLDALIENNLEKTRRLFRRCQAKNIPFLFISTDKAVQPVSAYGYTKALGEKLAWHYGGAVARLGNILNSSGSVIPLWEAQLAAGQPLTVTDPAMTRYLIEADEAVKQIWAAFLTGQRLIIPAMGQPVRLIELVERVLQKHGMTSIDEYLPGIEVIGRRKGEKRHEKLSWPNERKAQ